MAYRDAKLITTYRIDDAVARLAGPPRYRVFVGRNFGLFGKRYALSMIARGDRECARCGLSVEMLGIYRFDGADCFWPVAERNGRLITFTCDHITPLTQGGENSAENRQLMCWPCNQRKGCDSPPVNIWAERWQSMLAALPEREAAS